MLFVIGLPLSSYKLLLFSSVAEVRGGMDFFISVPMSSIGGDSIDFMLRIVCDWWVVRSASSDGPCFWQRLRKASSRFVQLNRSRMATGESSASRIPFRIKPIWKKDYILKSIGSVQSEHFAILHKKLVSLPRCSVSLLSQPVYLNLSFRLNIAIFFLAATGQDQRSARPRSAIQAHGPWQRRRKPVFVDPHCNFRHGWKRDERRER